jgi:hypothetical protein
VPLHTLLLAAQFKHLPQLRDTRHLRGDDIVEHEHPAAFFDAEIVTLDRLKTVIAIDET